MDNNGTDKRLRTLEIEVARMKDKLDTIWRIGWVIITPILTAIGVGIIYLIMLVSELGASKP